MKVLIVYDSVFGNTEKTAQVIGNAMGSQAEVNIVRVGNVKQANLRGLDVLIVGSPTRAFKPTKEITDFLEAFPKNGLKGVKVAAFDTRFTMSAIEESRVLPFFGSLSFQVGSAGYSTSLFSLRSRSFHRRGRGARGEGKPRF